MSDTRNGHLVRLLDQEVRSRERVSVVVGRNHVPMVASTLRCVVQR